MPPAQFDIAWEDFAALEIPLPPVEEQRRIADFLDDQVTRLDQLRSLRLSQRALVDAAITNERDQIVLDLGGKWGWTTLRRAIVGIEQGWSPECEQTHAEEDEWAVLKVGAVKRGRFVESEHKRLPDDLTPRTNLQVRAGDLLFSRANTPDLVGDSCVVPSDVRPRLMLSDKLMRVTLREGWLPNFVVLCARTTHARAHWSSRSSGASQSMVNVRGEDVKDLEVPEAPQEVQLEVARLAADSADTAALAKVAFDGSIELLEERKRALITAAVTGEMDVTTARPIGMGKWVPNVGASVDAPAAAQASSIGGIG
jgi:type I restriction enzyme S subunit